MPGVAEPRECIEFDISLWQPLLREHTADVVLLPVSSGLISSLCAGTLTLPTVAVPEPLEKTWCDGSPVEGHEGLSACGRESSSSRAESDRQPPASGHDGTEGPAAELRRLSHEIESAISRLGGAVAPKLGSVAPSDATWISFHRSMRCETAGDVLTLLSASERVMSFAQNRGEPTLALRAWIDGIERAAEYRVFVSDDEIVAISQRDMNAPTVLADPDMDRFVDLMQVFMDQNVHRNGPHLRFISSGRYVYDVFVDRNWRVWIIDFAPWGAPTDPVLFTWEELEGANWMSSAHARAQLRCISSDSAIRPSQSVFDGVPVELRSECSRDALVDAARRLIRDEDE
jgi:hypothetical protein